MVEFCTPPQSRVASHHPTMIVHWGYTHSALTSNMLRLISCLLSWFLLMWARNSHVILLLHGHLVFLLRMSCITSRYRCNFILGASLRFNTSLLHILRQILPPLLPLILLIRGVWHAILILKIKRWHLLVLNLLIVPRRLDLHLMLTRSSSLRLHILIL